MTLAERARVALKGEWMPGMSLGDIAGMRIVCGPGLNSRAVVVPAAYMSVNISTLTTPDLTDEPTVLALAAVCRRRLGDCDIHGVTTARREILAYALRDWACGSLTLADLAERVVYVMELIE